MSYKALLGFAPFAVFALVENLAGIVPGLAAGLVVSLALVAWEMARHRAFNSLEAGSAILFGTLTILASIEARRWSVWEVRLYVDAGLALVVLLGILARRPFTAQHARRIAAPEITRSRDFLRHNMWLSGLWSAAFAALAAVDLVMTTHPGTPARRGILLTLAILATAAKLTQWYVRKIRRDTGPAASPEAIP